MTASAMPSSSEQSSVRGRTLERVPAYDYLNFQTLVGSRGTSSIDNTESRLRQTRLLSKDLTVEPEAFDDCIMEPLPFASPRSSLSEELFRAATFDSLMDLTGFVGHRDTFALFSLRRFQCHRHELPEIFFRTLLHYIDSRTYLAIRLSCRSWSAAISNVRPVRLPPVRVLPAEILENIFTHLSPLDFNAARHTCRAWMIASLEERLLLLMLKRGYWLDAAKADAGEQGGHTGPNTIQTVNQEWLLSKRLATECSLNPGWTGNGLSASSPSLPEGSFITTGIVHATEMDFSKLSGGYSAGADCQSTLRFTVSVCHNFLLAVNDCAIYIYTLRDNAVTSHQFGGHLSPLTTVLCPRRVLAVSMDTSSQRFAVAALLEGRFGLVCDLHEELPLQRTNTMPRTIPSAALNPIMCAYGASVYSAQPCWERISPEGVSAYAHSFRASPRERAAARAIAEASLAEVHGVRPISTSFTADECLVFPGIDPSRPSALPSSTGKNPIETRIRSIYGNLCSEDDPPRSVAICPQRRCVAYGNSAGIELHWIDALTGQNLNRWFPLAAPSDFLYFLPLRAGVDSPKSLRLISSAAHPREQEGLQGHFLPGKDRSVQQGLSWDEGTADHGEWNNAWRGIGWCDHYKAVPISDGWNILFTHPEEGTLCMGSDSPHGAGVTGLVRRVIFVGPADETGQPIVPTVYAAGRELRWGIRVAAGYDDRIWLFVVPPDIFFGEDKIYKSHTVNNTCNAKPIGIEGVEIGRMQGLVDITVDASGGDLTIWTFAANGLAYVWQMGGTHRIVDHRNVHRDRTVSTGLDVDGDTTMPDAPSTPAAPFNGTATVSHTSPPLMATQDYEGDVLMRDANDEEDEGYASGCEEYAQAGGPFAVQVPELWERWNGEDVDWVPNYLVDREGGYEDDGLGLEAGVDVLELCRLDCKILCG